MRKSLTGVLGIGVSLLGVACAPAEFSGTVGEYELGKMQSAYFDVYDDESGISQIFFADYKWTCEELQEAAANDSQPPVKDPEQVNQFLSVVVLQYDETPETAAEVDYKIVDDYKDLLELSSGAYIAYVSVSLANNSGSVEDYYSAENGTFTLESVDLTKSLSGSVSMSLSTGAIVEGTFSASRCDLPD